jgi:uncharacterized Fe-S cluster-containing radical SAM superfamily protein
MDYQRYLTPNSKPFDPLLLACETEKIACQGNKRKYTGFYATGVYGGIATGYTVGCPLRCFYCWVDLSRDFPERYGEFYSPRQAFEKISFVAIKFGVKKARISGAEPTLGKEHLLELLGYIEKSDFKLFILETNGIIFGNDFDYVKKVSNFSKIHIRLCLKAGEPEKFEERTGAKHNFFELPFNAIKNLIKSRCSFHVAAMTDRRIMKNDEREKLIKKLWNIEPLLVKNLEEEIIDPYDTTLQRLKFAGIRLSWR